MKTISAKSKDLKTINEAIRQNVNGTPVTVSSASHLHGLAAGLKHGEVVVQGRAGPGRPSASPRMPGSTLPTT